MEPKSLRCSDFCEKDSKTFVCGNFPVTCKTCDNKEFCNVGILEVHFNKVHHLDPMEQCDECGSTFKRRMGLILHFRQTHMGPDPTYGKALGCDICDAFLVINGFSSYDDLVEHTEKVHGADTFINTPGNAGRSKCPLVECQGAFTYRKGMIEHLQVIHGEHLIEQMLHFTGEDKEKLCTERRFKCKHCKRLFTVRKSLVSHLEKIHNDFSGVRYGTATVNSDQVHNSSYNERLKVDIKKPPERKRTSISKYLEDYHTDISQNPAIQPCPHCPQVFTRKSILVMHIKMSHKNEKKEEKVQLEKKAKKDHDDEEDLELELPEVKMEIKEEKIDVEENMLEKPDLAEEVVKVIDKSLTKSKKVQNKKGASPEQAKPFYSAEAIAAVKAENHHNFYDDSVACEASADPDEEREPCADPKCDRKFITYFSMMRHVAFFHRAQKTATIMRRKKVVKPTTLLTSAETETADEIQGPPSKRRRIEA